MIILLCTELELSQAKSRDLIPLECRYCKNKFHKKAGSIRLGIRQYKLHPETEIPKRAVSGFCSKRCRHIAENKTLVCKCSECNTTFLRGNAACMGYKTRKNGSSHLFCSHRCHGFYAAKHYKKKTSARSKMEIYTLSQLQIIFPNINFLPIDKTAIGRELDVYIPNLKLAIEFNGIFHYQPIFGLNRLLAAQRNDIEKVIICKEKNIDLHVIDTSKMKYYSIYKCAPYIEMCISIINNKIKQLNNEINF